jgi:uncharacterized protein
MTPETKKALYFFLGLTFGLTILIATIARLMGFTLTGTPALMSQMVVLAAMFIPAGSAIITQKFVLRKPLLGLGFKLGPLSMYAKTYGIIVTLFIINYGITWMFIQKPDFSLISFVDQYMPGSTLPFPPYVMLAIMAFSTFIIVPFLNLLPSLGEEIGWRGFLLPNLEPMGKIKAMVISGMIWALWHTPMILILGFAYGNQMWPGAVLHFMMVSGLGIWMAYIWFRTRSTVLAAFMHATFNANAYGIGAMIFVNSNKLIIGAAGLVGALLCLLLGMVTLYFASRQSTVVSRQSAVNSQQSTVSSQQSAIEQ